MTKSLRETKRLATRDLTKWIERFTTWSRLEIILDWAARLISSTSPSVYADRSLVAARFWSLFKKASTLPKKPTRRNCWYDWALPNTKRNYWKWQSWKRIKFCKTLRLRSTQGLKLKICHSAMAYIPYKHKGKANKKSGKKKRKANLLATIIVAFLCLLEVMCIEIHNNCTKIGLHPQQVISI